MLFEVEVSHEQLTTVCETQSNQSTTLIAHFVIQISMQTLFFFVGLHKLCYQIEEKNLFIFSSWAKVFEQMYDKSSNVFN